MNRKNVTRNAFVTSAISLLLCVSMLVGTTFAWFTDSVTSAGNKVVAGNLDVELYQWTDADTPKKISEANAPLFGEDGLAQNDAAATLWEPGKTQVVYLSIKNEGSLDLKYKVSVNVKNPADGKNLYEAMQYSIIRDAKFGEVKSWTGGNDVVPGVNATEATSVAMAPGAEHFFALAVHMKEEADNKYQEGKVEFDICVDATQMTAEEDSFGSNYDALAAFPGSGKGKLESGEKFEEIALLNREGRKMGSALVPAEAIYETDKEVEIIIDESQYEGNFTIDDGMEKKVMDITAKNLAEDNTTPIKVELNLKPGMDPATVKLYHYDTKIPCSYNPHDGNVTFETAKFSPFTLVYDAESRYVAPEINDQTKIPTATVTPYTDTANIQWESYGQWSPTTGLEAQLDAAYTFKCPETIDPAFEHWYCDFYVKLDKPLAENEIFLGGNYGDFGWIGFHNGDLTLEANTEIGLLESVTTNPWTYRDVYDLVGEFICGVGNVGDSLTDATFTVMLRLTNPENPGQFYNVNTVTYNFATGESVVTPEQGN